MTIDLNTATRAEILHFARTELGLKVEQTISRADLVQRVSTQLGTVVADGNDANAAEPDLDQRAALADLRKQEYYTIRIHENPDYQNRLPVIVNGVLFTYVPGAEVDVPASVVEVLNNAITTTYKQIDDGRGGLTMVPHRANTYPFTILGKKYK